MPQVEKITPYNTPGLTKTEQVKSMFDNIAPAYDFMNHAMTAGIDRMWLHALLKTAGPSKPADIADLATGTGEVAFALARKFSQARITGIDLSDGMLAKARTKAAKSPSSAQITFRQGDCTATGLPEASFDLVTVAYGVRNFADIRAGYAEMHRILRDGGMLCVLELGTPQRQWASALYRLYTSTLIPFAGRMLSHDTRAYSYLPESIAAAPQREAMVKIIMDAGFSEARFKELTFGSCILYTAVK